MYLKKSQGAYSSGPPRRAPLNKVPTYLMIIKCLINLLSIKTELTDFQHFYD